MAQGAIVTYTDRTAFLAALSGPAFENDFQTMPTSAVGSPRSFSANGFGYQISAVNGLIGIDIAGDISIAAVSASSSLNVINLTGGVTAVGGYFFFDNNASVSATGAGTLTANNGVDPRGGDERYRAVLAHRLLRLHQHQRPHDLRFLAQDVRGRISGSRRSDRRHSLDRFCRSRASHVESARRRRLGVVRATPPSRLTRFRS